MRRATSRMMLLALLVPMAGSPLGCGDREGGDVDFGGEVLGPDRFSIVTRGGEVRMGLTDRFVYFAMSEERREETRAEMEQELGEGEGIGGLLGGVLSTAVDKALGFRAKYPVEEVRDIRWEDGRMRIVFTDPDRRMSENMIRVDDAPATDAFTEEDVRAFGEAFRALKAESGATAPAGGV